MFSATPVSDHWNPIKSSKIPGTGLFQIIFSATDMALDLLVLCLPLPVTKNLHMSTKRKFVVAGVFWVGSLSVAPLALSSTIQWYLLTWIPSHSCVLSSTVRLYYTIEVININGDRDFGRFNCKSRLGHRHPSKPLIPEQGML